MYDLYYIIYCMIPLVHDPAFSLYAVGIIKHYLRMQRDEEPLRRNIIWEDYALRDLCRFCITLYDRPLYVVNNKTENIIQILVFNPYDNNQPCYFFPIRNVCYYMMCINSNFRQIVHSYIQYIYEEQSCMEYNIMIQRCTRAKERTCPSIHTL